MKKLFLGGYIAEALPPLEATTNAGNIQKRRYMSAIACKEGMIDEENPELWKKCLEANISKDDVCSIFFGARIGLIPKEEASKHFQMLKELADAGDIFAQYELAQYEDSENKLKYMKLAADQNYFLAAFEPGKMYFLAEDNEQARRYFEIAAQSEQHINSMLYLGDIYWNGFGGEVDKEKAVELYEKAHERGGFSDNSIVIINSQWIITKKPLPKAENCGMKAKKIWQRQHTTSATIVTRPIRRKPSNGTRKLPNTT